MANAHIDGFAAFLCSNDFADDFALINQNSPAIPLGGFAD